MHRQMRFLPSTLALLLAFASPLAAAVAADDRFDIARFQIVGNTLLPVERVDAVVAPYAGKGRNYADVQRALEALEREYRLAGYGAVLVHVPEQELTHGDVRLQVIEARLGKVTIASLTPDGRHYGEENIRASLPALREGATPNTPAIAENVQLANENPAKQVEVVLKASEEFGRVDAEVSVQASAPLKAFVTLDNTGSRQTGSHRVGVGLQHANLFDRDHVATLNYTTSPEKPKEVNLYSLSYRLPLYEWGDSVDFIAAKSDVDAGSTATVAGPLAFSGRGEVLGVRYNWLLPRRGEYSHRVVFGFDRRAFDNTCSLGTFGAAGCGPSGVDVTVRPWSVTYAGQLQSLSQAIDFSLAYVQNWAGGKNGGEADFKAARPSSDGSTGASAHYSLVRANGSLMRTFAGDWQLRLAGSGQIALDALISAEQVGLAGATTVRGFAERAAARDTGYVANVEAYTPNFAPQLGLGRNLRALAFFDQAGGRNLLLSGDAQQRIRLASAGVGVRLLFDSTLSVKLDAARVVDGDSLAKTGDWQGHLGVYYSF